MKTIRQALFTLLLVLFVAFPAACGSDDEGRTSEAEDGTGAVAANFTLASSSFEDGGTIPLVLACEDLGGSNQSPQLTWENPPPGTGSYAVIMDDESPPCGTGVNACMHWSVFNIPAGVTSLAAGEDVTLIEGVIEGLSYKGEAGYAGPCPPGAHVYRITVFALEEGMPPFEAGTEYNRAGFVQAYDESILGSATIEGTYSP